MPILFNRDEGRSIRNIDHNTIAAAFSQEHVGDEVNNVHKKTIRLGQADANDVREVIAPLLAGERKLQYNPTYASGTGAWGRDQSDGDGFHAFLTDKITVPPFDADYVVYSKRNGLVCGLRLSGMESDPEPAGRFSLTAPFFITGGSSTPVKYVIGQRRSGTANDQVLISGELGIVDMATRIDRDGLGNMTFSDIVAGTWKLKQLVQTNADTAFSPEFDDAVVYDPTNAQATVGNILSSSFDATDFHNFYKWTVPGASEAEVRVMLRVKLPTPFFGWQNIRCFFRTTHVLLSFLDIKLYGTNNAAAVLSGGTGLTSLGWSQYTILVSSGVFAQGEYITLEFKFRTQQGQAVFLGEVQLNYA